MDKNWISVDVWIRPVFPDLVTYYLHPHPLNKQWCLLILHHFLCANLNPDKKCSNLQIHYEYSFKPGVCWPVTSMPGFLKLLSCRYVRMYACMYMCMYAPKTIKTSGKIWTLYDWLKVLMGLALETKCIISYHQRKLR